jgi:hypothetical protein
MRNAKSRYVTKTGRAISPGTVTRAGHAVKRPKAKPLPMHLQCHPKALAPTPTNPGCFKGGQPHWGLGLFSLDLTREQLRAGVGLSQEPKRFSLFHTADNVVLGHTDDVTFAMAYMVRANARHLYLEVIENE